MGSWGLLPLLCDGLVKGLVRDVLAYFHVCCVWLLCVCHQVVKVERIQHARLWRRYALRRGELLESRGRAGEQRSAVWVWLAYWFAQIGSAVQPPQLHSPEAEP